MKEKVALASGIGMLIAAWCHAGLGGPTKNVFIWFYDYVVHPILSAIWWVICFFYDFNLSDWF